MCPGTDPSPGLSPGLANGFVQLLPYLRLILLLSGASLWPCFLPGLSLQKTTVPALQCTCRILCYMPGVPSKGGAEHQDTEVFSMARPLARALREPERVVDDVSCLPIGSRPETVEEKVPSPSHLQGHLEVT